MFCFREDVKIGMCVLFNRIEMSILKLLKWLYIWLYYIAVCVRIVEIYAEKQTVQLIKNEYDDFREKCTTSPVTVSLPYINRIDRYMK